jgi:N-methylhydantoinase B
MDGLKIVAAGREDPQVRRLIASNIRFPVESLGDLRAQIAACRIGERRLGELVARYGSGVVFGAIETIWERSEAAARRKVAETPDGVYEASSFLDGDGASGEPVHMRVRVTVEGDRMSVDLGGSSPQVAGNINCGESASVAAVRVAFKSFTSPETPADEGSFRPLEVVVPPRSFLSAAPGAAVTQWSASIPQLIDTVLLALSQAGPDRVPAGHHGSLAPYIWVGPLASGSSFVHIDTCCGGWGAAPGHDGGVGLKSYMHGDTRNVPVEIEEAMFPLRVESYELLPDSGGAGRWRGGPASAKRFRSLADLRLNFSFPRAGCPPWGREGGGDGRSDKLLLLDAEGTLVSELQTGTLLPLPAGTQVVTVSGSGGGYGPPGERDPEAVRADVLAGYVSEAAARDVYGLEEAQS